MRLSRNVVVKPLFSEKRLVSFVDDNGDGVQDIGEQELSSLSLPGTGGGRIFLMGPDGVAATDEDPAEAIDGFTTIASSGSRHSRRSHRGVPARRLDPRSGRIPHLRRQEPGERVRGSDRAARHCEGGDPEVRLR